MPKNTTNNPSSENRQVKLFIWGSVGLVVLVVLFFVGSFIFLFSSSDKESTQLSDNQTAFIQQPSMTINDQDVVMPDMFVTKAPSKPQLTQPTVSFIDPQIGPKDAPITIVEFADFNCSFCAEVQSVLSELFKKYPKQIKLVFKNLPIKKLHLSAENAAEAALCAGKQNKFWQYHDLLFANQDFFSVDILTGFAKELELNTTSFSSCLDDHEMKPLVDKSLAEATELEIDGTPHFYINAQELGGSASLEDFVRVIEVELKK